MTSLHSARTAGMLTAAVAAVAVTSQPPPAASVLLDVFARHPDGRLERHLSADAIELRVDGEPVTIDEVRAGPTPLALIMLIDVSRSFAPFGGRDDSLARHAVETFVSRLENADRARIGSVGSRLRLTDGLTADRVQLRADARAAFAHPDSERSGPSPIWDAIDVATSRLGDEPGRRAVIVLTDGQATGNRLGIAELADRAVTTASAVCFVTAGSERYIKQNPTTAARVRPAVPLEDIASYTGGALVRWEPDDAGGWRQRGGGSWVMQAPRYSRANLTVALETVFEELRAAQTVVFRPPKADGKWHEIEVRATAGDLVFRARRAFVAPNAPLPPSHARRWPALSHLLGLNLSR